MATKSTKETRIERLNQVQEERKQKALKSVNTALEKMVKQGAKINFQTVAREANVSVSYLYKYPEIKTRIAEIRNQQSVMPRPRMSEPTSNKSHQKIVNRLKNRIKQLEREVTELKKLNQGLAGQVYRVSELEAMVERQRRQIEDLETRLKECMETKQVVKTTKERKVTPISQAKTKKSDINNQIKSELKTLGIKLTTTLRSTINAADEQTVVNAIEALKEALEKDDIKSPGGWLKSAIEGGWVKNKTLQMQEKSPYPEEFTEWYEIAVEAGFVLDIPINHLNLDGHNHPLVKVDKPSSFAPYTQMPWREAKAEMESLNR